MSALERLNLSQDSPEITEPLAEMHRGFQQLHEEFPISEFAVAPARYGFAAFKYTYTDQISSSRSTSRFIWARLWIPESGFKLAENTSLVSFTTQGTETHKMQRGERSLVRGRFFELDGSLRIVAETLKKSLVQRATGRVASENTVKQASEIQEAVEISQRFRWVLGRAREDIEAMES